MVTKRRKNILKQWLFLLLVSSVISCNSQEKTHIHNLSLQQLTTRVLAKNTLLIDVRTPKEYNAGHLKNAININYYDTHLFLTKIANLDKNTPVYIYCHSGVRSRKASKILEQLGFDTIYDFSGGWKTWTKYKEKIKTTK